MMTSERSGLRIVAALTLAMGIIWFGLAYKVGVSSVRASDERVSTLRQAPIITAAAQLDESLVGRRILLQGALAGDNPTAEFTDDDGTRRQFIIYSATRFHYGTPGANGVTTTEAVKERTVSPPVAIRLDEGSVRVTNSGYYTDGPGGALVKPEADLVVGGLGPGDKVLVDGTVIRRDGTLAVEATVLSTSSLDYYVAAGSDQRGRGLYIFGGQLLAGFGALCIGLAAIMGTVAGLGARRARREFAAELARVAAKGTR